MPGTGNNFSNNMVVSGTATLDVLGGAAVSFGSLSIGASGPSTLHVTGGSTTFTAATIANSPVFYLPGGSLLNLGPLSGATGFSTTGGGTLVVSGTNAAGSGSSVSINGGSLVAVGQNYKAPGPAIGPLGGAAVTLNNATLALAASSAAPITFDLVSGNALTLAGSNDSIIAGSTLAGVGSGTITLAGSNTFPIAAGNTLNLGAVNGYTLIVGPGLAFSNSGTINVPAGAVTLQASNLSYSGGAFTAASGSTLTLASPVSGGTYSAAAGGTVVLSSSYSGPLANLAPASGGTLVIGSNLSTGTLNVAGGAYIAQNPSSFGPATLQLNGGSLGAMMPLTGGNAIANALTWGGTQAVTFVGNNMLTLSAALNLTSGTYNVNDPAGLATFTGPISNSAVLNITGSSTVSGAISGSGSLGINGNATLSASNSYSGGTTLNSGANATITNNRSFGTGPITFNGGGFNATVPLTGGAAITNAWTISAGSAAYFNGANAVQLTSSTSLAAGSELIHLTNPGLTVTLSGLISGSGMLVRAQDGGGQTNGTLVINNPGNTFSGGFTLQTLGGNIDVQGASTVTSGSNIVSGPLGTGVITIGSAANGYLGLNNSSPVAVTLANPVNLYEDCGFNSPAGLTLSGPMTVTTGNAVYNVWLARTATPPSRA